jgi:hypothetical protein
MPTMSSLPFIELENQLPRVIPQSKPKKEMPCFCKRGGDGQKDLVENEAMEHEPCR